MLIKIITSCFNEALIKHLTDSLLDLQNLITNEEYKTRHLQHLQPPQVPGQPALPGALPGVGAGEAEQDAAGAPPVPPVD